MPHLDAALVALVVCLVAGLLVPDLIARIPEPESDPDSPASPDCMVPPRAPKPTYAAVAARPRLRVLAAVSSGLAGGLAGLVLGWQWGLLLVLVVVPIGVALAVVDWHTRLLPTVVVLPATGVVLLLVAADWVWTRQTDDALRAVIGLLIARSGYWLLWRLHSAGMGFGDVRLAALLGLTLGFLGWAEFVVGMYSGFLVFGIPGLLLALVRRDRALLRKPYPFGPFMLAGALLGVLVGQPVLAGLVGG